jgi:hypothetical protein
MALKLIRVHHSDGRYRIYECSYCRKQVAKRYTTVRRGVQSCGCLRGGRDALRFCADGRAVPKKVLPLSFLVTYRGVEKSLGQWLEQYAIPQTVFNRWYVDGRRPTWIVARYANGVRRNYGAKPE